MVGLRKSLKKINFLVLMLILFSVSFTYAKDLPVCCPSSPNVAGINSFYKNYYNPDRFVDDEFFNKMVNEKVDQSIKNANLGIQSCEEGFAELEGSYLTELKSVCTKSQFYGGSTDLTLHNFVCDDPIKTKENVNAVIIEYDNIYGNTFDGKDIFDDWEKSDYKEIPKELKIFSNDAYVEKMTTKPKVMEESFYSCVNELEVQKIKCESKLRYDSEEIKTLTKKFNDCMYNKICEFEEVEKYINSRNLVLRDCYNYYSSYVGSQGYGGDSDWYSILYQTGDKYKDLTWTKQKLYGPPGGKINPVIPNKKPGEETINHLKKEDKKHIYTFTNLVISLYNTNTKPDSIINGYLTYYGVDEEGNKVTMPNAEYKTIIPTIVGLKGKSKLEVNIIPEKKYDNESATINFEIKINGKLEDNNEVKIYLNAETIDKNQVFFTVSPKPKLEITSLSKRSSNNAWDESWSTYEVSINNPKNNKVVYTISSSVPGSNIRVEKKNWYGTGRIYTKKTSLNFGWKAPKISTDYRIDYIKKLQNVEAGVENKIFSNLANDKVVQRLNLKGMADDAESVKSLVDASNNFGVNGIKALNGDYKQRDGESSVFYYTKNFVRGFSLVEGVIGNYVPKEYMKLNTVWEGVSYGLIPLDEWYKTVEEMIDVGNAKIKSNTQKITVCVDNNYDKTCKDINVKIEGYEKLLK